VSYAITKNWSTFLEYKGTYSFVDVDIDSNAKLKTDVKTNAVNLGIAYKF
jgi:lipid A oxidase